MTNEPARTMRTVMLAGLALVVLCVPLIAEYAAATAPSTTMTVSAFDGAPVEARFDYGVGDTPTIYVKEDGSSQPGQEYRGRIFRYAATTAAPLGNYETCTFVSQDGTTLREYTSPGQYGLAVTPTGQTVVGCVLQSPAGFQTSIRAMNATDGLFSGAAWAGNAELIVRRVDAATLNCATVTIPLGYVGFYDVANGVSAGAVDPGGQGAFAIDWTGTNRVAVTGPYGLGVYQCNSNGEGGTRIIVTDSGLPANAIAFQGGDVFLATSTRLRHYTWNETTFTPIKTTTNVTITEANRDMGVRLSKDGQYVIHWSGQVARIVNTTLLQTVFTTDAVGGVIKGCDMDLRNNYLACAVGSPKKVLAWNVYCHTEAFGAGAGACGSLNPAPSSGTNPYNDLNVTFLLNLGGDALAGPPDVVFGADLGDVAESYGLTEATMAAAFGLLIVFGCAVALYALGDRKPLVGVLGAFIGVGVNFGFSLWPLWALVVSFFLLAVVLVLKFRSGSNAGGGD